MCLMAKDYANMKDGFPDLMLVKDDTIRFIEVKSEGDVIRRNQLTRIKQLRRAGFDCDIVRIKWRVDPNQLYVVVDVETTGGRGGNHRVTEIGAVKIRGGEIIDEWQSLINSERHIPKYIQTLTGINNNMVSGAPEFSDIATAFGDFIGDDIFAAHNVNFEYGFISREYRRLDKKFTALKICTCASMRKYYPRRKSYSLKNLCQKFDIDPTNHHRALSDARAAAKLLTLVNTKRLSEQDKNGK